MFDLVLLLSPLFSSSIHTLFLDTGARSPHHLYHHRPISSLYIDRHIHSIRIKDAGRPSVSNLRLLSFKHRFVNPRSKAIKDVNLDDRHFDPRNQPTLVLPLAYRNACTAKKDPRFKGGIRIIHNRLCIPFKDCHHFCTLTFQTTQSKSTLFFVLFPTHTRYLPFRLRLPLQCLYLLYQYQVFLYSKSPLLDRGGRHLIHTLSFTHSLNPILPWRTLN